MLVQYIKAVDGSVTQKFTRRDRTTTSRRINPAFVRHEILHFAVEGVLDLHRGFIGLIEGGRDVADFDADSGNWLPVEAQQSEAVVSALGAELNGSALKEDFVVNLEAICRDVGIPTPPRADDKSAHFIRAAATELYRMWEAVSPGESLDLDWPTQLASPLHK